MKLKMGIVAVSMMLVSGYLIVCSAYSQSGSRDSGSATRSGAGSSRPTSQQPPFEVRFWEFLSAGKHRYDYWGPFAGKTEMYEGQSPHGAHLRVFANRTAREAVGDLPANSIIIKENYAEDKTTLVAITAMYKVDGFDAENGNWYYVKYNPDGSVATAPADQGGAKLAGRVDACIDCHKDAGGGDFIFLND